MTSPGPRGTFRLLKVPPGLVRPAHGFRLRRVQDLECGDRVAAFDGSIHPLLEARPTRNGRWLLTYTSGPPVSLPPRAILRLRDSIPNVMFHG